MVHSIAKFLYGLAGTVFLLLGVAIVSLKTGLVPAGIEAAIYRATDNNMYGLHLLQEFGAMLVFAGLISFWFIKNYEQGMGFHWAMTVFWALIAMVHWFDVRGIRSYIGPVINTIPVALFVTVGVLRKKS